ncbi:DNA-directed RNA polymerase I subunit RPB5z [Novymonas esmeraldas]|uniref:DNA-directed RNA polymerase I subunit RPB5z n=1 Tax=Novymonas esmeraldas TaxID=1808958 RepID=A0AAW0EUG8_9TRYP
MSSIEELKVVRLFRAFNTMIQLCHDRGYVIRHPSAVAEAVRDPALYDPAEGLDYDWFLRHFVVSPQRALGSARAKTHTNNNSSSNSRGGGTAAPAQDVNHYDEEAGAEKDDELVDEAEMLRRAASGEWVCMRNAMRLTCSMAAAAPAVKDGDAPLSTAAAATTSRAARNALMVHFSGTPKLSMKEVHAFREKALKKKASSMIIVTNKAEPGVRMDVQELSGRMDEATGAELLSLQVLEEEALAFNVVRHETVPHHAVLTPAEAAAFLAERRLSVAQLPRMLDSDPLVQYLGLQRGSIVHIVRDGKQSGPYSMYRHVI